MKKLLIVLLLLTLTGCKPNQSLDEYVSLKSEMVNGEILYYFDPNGYVIYDNTYPTLQFMDTYFIYVEIEEMPFYELANKNKVELYWTGRYAGEIFVKASDIHTIKIEV